MKPHNWEGIYTYLGPFRGCLILGGLDYIGRLIIIFSLLKLQYIWGTPHFQTPFFSIFKHKWMNLAAQAGTSMALTSVGQGMNSARVVQMLNCVSWRP
jgi:hypothetical protein